MDRIVLKRAESGKNVFLTWIIQHGYTQDQVARGLHMSPENLSAILHRERAVTGQFRKRIQKLTGFKFDELFEMVGPLAVKDRPDR